MRRGSLSVVLLLLLGVSACGPKTIASILNPMTYTVTTVVDFQDNGVASRQTLVSHCTVIDQTDSVAANYSVDAKGEPHWLKRADGSIWLLTSLQPCRWWNEKPVAGAPMQPVVQRALYEQPPDTWSLSDGPVYRIDSVERPVQLEVYGMHDLFEGGIDGVSAKAQLGPGGGEVSRTLRQAFSWLARAAAAEPARQKAAAAEGKKRQARSEVAASPLRFIGFNAEVRQLDGGLHCQTADPNAAGPVLIAHSPKCLFATDCPPPSREIVIPCQRPLGMLRPRFDAGYRTVRFGPPKSAERDYRQTLVNERALYDADAPGFRKPYGTWAPEVCLEGVCATPERFGLISFYYPARNILVHVRIDSQDIPTGLPD